MIRVANIIEEGRLGGPQIRMVLVESALKKLKLKKKIKTTFIFPKKNSRKFQKICNTNSIKYYLFSLRTLNRNFRDILTYLVLFPVEVFMLSSFLKKHSFDIVHVSGGSWQYKGVLAARIAKIKVVWELNDTYTPKITRYVFFLLSRLANSFIFASERTKKYYSKLLPKKKNYFLIQSPVDINLFDPSLKLKTDKIFKKKNLKKKIIIGTVGNINPNKGLTTFLKAAKKIFSYDNKVIFVIVGPIYESQKRYYKYLLNLIKTANIKNVYFIGSRKDVRTILKSMDIYVCSSDNESSPLAVWEAMAMKKAVVSTDVGDVKKFIKNGVNGFVFKVGDAKGLSKGVIKLINNQMIRSKFGKSSREVIKNKLNSNLCARLHAEAYSKTFLDN